MSKDLKTLVEEYNETIKQIAPFRNMPIIQTIDTNTDNITVQNIYFRSGFNIPLFDI